MPRHSRRVPKSWPRTTPEAVVTSTASSSARAAGTAASQARTNEIPLARMYPPLREPEPVCPRSLAISTIFCAVRPGSEAPGPGSAPPPVSARTRRRFVNDQIDDVDAGAADEGPFFDLPLDSIAPVGQIPRV